LIEQRDEPMGQFPWCLITGSKLFADLSLDGLLSGALARIIEFVPPSWPSLTHVVLKSFRLVAEQRTTTRIVRSLGSKLFEMGREQSVQRQTRFTCQNWWMTVCRSGAPCENLVAHYFVQTSSWRDGDGKKVEGTKVEGTMSRNEANRAYRETAERASERVDKVSRDVVGAFCG
jgi:hypothetical protein